MLKDNVGRRFEYLRLSITDACNFRCNYCLPDGYHCDGDRNFLNLTELQTLVSAFAALGIKKIRITGGEPLLRKDLPEIIALCKETAGIKKVALTTNGFNLGKMAPVLAKAGLDAINVSLDSIDPHMFQLITGQNKLRQVMAGIDAVMQTTIHQLKLNAVLMKQFNVSQLHAYQQWIKDKPLTLRFIELMETSDNKHFFAQNHVKGTQIKQQLLQHGWTQMIRNKLAGPAEEFCHPDYQGKMGLIMPYSKDFCANCNRLRMSSTGQLHLCLFTDAHIDIRPMLTAQDVDATRNALLNALTFKDTGHNLHNHVVGKTSNLAMIGG